MNVAVEHSPQFVQVWQTYLAELLTCVDTWAKDHGIEASEEIVSLFSDWTGKIQAGSLSSDGILIILADMKECSLKNKLVTLFEYANNTARLMARAKVSPVVNLLS